MTQMKITAIILLYSAFSSATTETITLHAKSETKQIIQKEVTVNNQNGEYLFEGDILIDGYKSIGIFDVSSDSVIISGSQYRWSFGIVPFLISPLYSTIQEDEIFQAMENIEEVSGVVFVERTN